MHISLNRFMIHWGVHFVPFGFGPQFRQANQKMTVGDLKK